MPTPINRVPVRVARGNLATLQSAFDDLYDGELVYGLDTQALYCKDGGVLQPVAGEGVVSVNGQTGTVIINVEDLNDVDGTPTQGDTLVYVDGQFVFQQSVGNGTVTSVDVQGAGGISSADGPITSSGVITLTLDPTGVTPGEYVTPTVTVDAQGRITSIAAGTLPPLELNDLTNVDAPSPGVGDGIIWDGSNWISSPNVGGGDGASSIGELTDVDMSVPPNDGQALLWDDASNTFQPGDVSAGGGGSTFLNDLLDVEVTNPGFNQVLGYNASQAEWQNFDPSLNKLEDVRDVSVTGVANGDALLWDQATSSWIVGQPLSKGPISLETTVKTATDSPLWGGRNNMDQATWDSMGFTRFPTLGTFQDGLWRVIDLNGVDCAANGAVLYSGLTGTPTTTFNTNVKVAISIWHFVTIFQPNWSGSTQPNWEIDDYNYISNRTSGSRFELTALAEEAEIEGMDMVECGVLPRQTIDGEDWTIFRAEFVSFFNSSRTWARELWISEQGNLKVKQGQPTWNFNWTDTTVGQGISTGSQQTPGVTGYGDGIWSDLPRRGSYVVEFTKAEELPGEVDLGFNDLNDVTLTTPTTGEIVRYDGTNWVNEAFPATDISGQSIDQLSDVDTTTDAPTYGQALIWNGFNNWIPGPDVTQGGSSDVEEINDLSDVDTETTAPEVGQLLAWDGNNWVPADAPVTGATSLDDLSDVNVTSPAPEDTQGLFYSQADDEWQAANPRATAGAPTETNFPGKPGEMRYSADYFYICVAPNTWKQVALTEIGGTPDPELGDIADGGNFLDGTPGTIDTILDGGNWTTGASSDQENVVFDGGYFTPEPPPTPGPDDTIDGGDFIDGTPGVNAFLMDGGNFTTGAAGSADITLDGGFFSPNLPGANDTIDGGDFTDGTPGTDFRVDGGNFTTGAAGTANQVLDGGIFTTGNPGPDETVDGGDFTSGGSAGTAYYMDGGNFTTGAAGTGGTVDGGDFTSSVILPGADDVINGGDFTSGVGGTDFRIDGGNFTTGAAGTGGIQDGGYFSSIVNPANGGNFTTGLGGDLREIVDGGNFTLGWVIDDSAADGGDFTTDEAGSDNEILDGGDFSS